MVISQDPNIEGIGNMYEIKFSASQLRDIFMKDLYSLFDIIFWHRGQLLNNIGINNAYLYVWHDELAESIRFSLVTLGKKPPFGCRLNYVPHLEPILRSYTASTGLYVNDYTIIDSMYFNNQEDLCEKLILDVFMKRLGVNSRPKLNKTYRN